MLPNIYFKQYTCFLPCHFVPPLFCLLCCTPWCTLLCVHNYAVWCTLISLQYLLLCLLYLVHPTLLTNFTIFEAPFSVYYIWCTLLCFIYLVHPTLFIIFGAPYSVYYIVKARIMNCLIARIENMKAFLMWYSCIVYTPPSPFIFILLPPSPLYTFIFHCKLDTRRRSNSCDFIGPT